MRLALLRLGIVAVFATLLLGVMYMVVQNHSSQAGIILYDQYNNAGWSGSLSDANGGQAADDFVVPVDQTWVITQVEVAGIYAAIVRVPQSMNVQFYQDANTQPGAEIFAQNSITYTVFPFHSAEAQMIPTPAPSMQTAVDTTRASFAIPINPATLPSGTYWLSVHANTQFGPDKGDWLWAERPVVSGQPEVFRIDWARPCNAWTRAPDCNVRLFRGIYSDTTKIDEVFRLRGTILFATSPSTTTPTNPIPSAQPTKTQILSEPTNTVTPILPSVTKTPTNLPTST
ncbi:MAG TPA: hypothetical protein VGN15_13580, partial [Ktedonobacteraceae bacterium]|nr:hypothetical protein [Ktedonobacteraceae bacterium]